MQLSLAIRVATMVAIAGLASCQKRSKLTLQGQQYELVSEKTSSGGQFDIATYDGAGGQVHLILPGRETDLDEFAELYINTFEAQGFAMTKRGNEHLGLSAANVVYLTPAPAVEGLAILLAPRTADTPTTAAAAAAVFVALEVLE